MKNQLLFALFFAIIISVLFSFSSDHATRETAYVSQYEGFYIYTDCVPTRDFVVLDETFSSVATRRYSDIRRNVVNRAKRLFPSADGIIIHLEDKTYATIKFK